MTTAPTPEHTTRMTHTEQMELACERARADELQAWRLGDERYLVKSRRYNPGAYWLLSPRPDGTGWDCPCPATSICAHQGAIIRHLQREHGRRPVPQPWRDPVAPQPDPPRRDLTADERARLRVLCTPGLRARANQMANLMDGMRPEPSAEVRAIADRVTYGDLFPGCE